MKIFSFLTPVFLFGLFALGAAGFMDDPNFVRLLFYGSIIFIQSGLLLIAHNSAAQFNTKS